MSTLVFGATSTIGNALIENLLKRGQKVVAAGRDHQKLDQLAAKFSVATQIIDLSQPETFQSAVAFTIDKFGKLDGVVNLIGSLYLNNCSQTSFEDWQEVIDVNLNSCFHVLKASLKPMQKTGGSIVFVTSVASEIGMSNHEAIAAAKAGVAGLARAAAASYSNRNIRVNCVAPGFTVTEMTRKIWENDQSRQLSESMNPLGTLGEPQYISSCISWLLDEENKWVNGQVISVDGGMSTVLPKPRARLSS
ncbi:SDR family NAD(P)-dependent oxidoreductase [Rubinisphaera italica]|uniref:3-oxoacyl-[acyl-carrier-protein] reductase FabG n=1 Tax=Rubinisphaera italica TaxID=2527969 RepID=A0A5C5XE50_9PLAN|nr:SDR family oxidoreductase [Rubinisphaera italica]TWT60583.1 3-oxoacyl-[acyl-carrier-protein] reductase FabG [Rubinisphaera italica]